MCGITGKVTFDGRIISPSELELMSEKIWYRGPDDKGIYINRYKNLGLVSRRLAIIDLSKKGHQPMAYKDRYVITFNGEVYNFQSERSKLKRLGYKFTSDTDTEVILALYDRYKTKCLEFLRGMFAFAIYDSFEETLFLARDRLGKKPLKYFFNDQVFIFASELKAILTQKEIYKVPDLAAINYYLTFGYTPSPWTGFVDIRKLEPGCYLTLDIRNKKLTRKKYWEPDFNQKLKLSESDWCEKILEVLEESTKLRMISDVPIGAFLSGGVDSSLVVAMMARLSSKRIKTFTIGFEDQNYDERKYAENIARLYKTDHTVFVAKPESVEILPDLVYQYEEPYADSSAVITYMVSKMAKKYVTVVLNGDGGDENFAGYPRYGRFKRDVFLNKYEKLTRPVVLPVSYLLAGSKDTNIIKRANKFLEKSKTSLAYRFLTYNYFFSPEIKNKLYADNFKYLPQKYSSYELLSEKFDQAKTKDLNDKALYFELTNWFPEDLLAKVDIASMAVSLETRSPFTDHKMVELACQIPFKLKVKGWYEYKYILKKAAEKLVPKENIYRRKYGFTIPLSNWFTGSLNGYAKSILLCKSSKTKKYFNQDFIKSLLSRHSEKNDFGPQLWALLTLELWFQKYF